VNPRDSLDTAVAKKKNPKSRRESNPGCPTSSPVNIQTELIILKRILEKRF